MIERVEQAFSDLTEAVDYVALLELREYSVRLTTIDRKGVRMLLVVGTKKLK